MKLGASTANDKMLALNQAHSELINLLHMNAYHAQHIQ